LDVGHLGRAFLVYQGSHGDAGAHNADVILPGAAYTEKDGLYVNFEGRVQRGARAVFPPGDAKADWAILRALSDVLGKRLPYDDLTALRSALVAQAPHFARVGEGPSQGGAATDWDAVGAAGTLDDTIALASTMRDYYLTNPIARASQTMATCSREFVASSQSMAAE
jgi:NADH-quinone oxidoreductase subunit G